MYIENTNSENQHVGRKFQEFVQSILKEKYNTYFEKEVAIPIGKPLKNHKFDLANEDRSIVAECKCYTWTGSGNVPSAKMMGLNEAVFYGKSETLAEYYVRVHGHLLKDVYVFEISDDRSMKVISGTVYVIKPFRIYLYL